jgi:hypothetical protein
MAEKLRAAVEELPINRPALYPQKQPTNQRTATDYCRISLNLYKRRNKHWNSGGYKPVSHCAIFGSNPDVSFIE